MPYAHRLNWGTTEVALRVDFDVFAHPINELHRVVLIGIFVFLADFVTEERAVRG